MTPEPLIISGAMTNNLIAAYGAGKRRTPAAVKEERNGKCSTDTWVNFKLFGLMGLTLVFTIGIGVFMTKHAVTRQN